MTPVLVCLPVSGQLSYVSMPLPYALGDAELWVLCPDRSGLPVST